MAQPIFVAASGFLRRSFFSPPLRSPPNFPFRHFYLRDHLCSFIMDPFEPALRRYILHVLLAFQTFFISKVRFVLHQANTKLTDNINIFVYHLWLLLIFFYNHMKNLYFLYIGIS